MTNLLRAELLKLSTTRTFVAFVGVAVGLSLLLVVLLATLSEPASEVQAEQVITTDATGVFILLLAVIGITGEWRHRTITSSFLAGPDRVRLLVAKTIAYAAAGAVLSLLVNLVVMTVGTIILSVRDLPTVPIGDLADLIWRTLLVAGLSAGFGVGLGAIVRNQAVAIVAVLVLLFVVEPALLVLAPQVERFGPLVGAPAAISGAAASVGDTSVIDFLSAPLGALVLLAWVVVLVGIGAALLQRRDLT